MLITCPECEKEISSLAEKCPSCGYPILQRVNSTTIIKQKKEGCFLQTLNIGCLIILIIIGIIVFISFMSVIYSTYNKTEKIDSTKMEQNK
jgi:DNA-directed RNA polymerase subunit RPC12/RpoP